MRVLHVLPHLGGGVGRAHAALAPHLEPIAHQVYVLLETPAERRYIDAIKDTGADVWLADDAPDAEWMTFGNYDLIQIEWWENTRLRSFLSNWTRPDKPIALWSHQSRPIPDGFSTADCLIGTAPVCNLPFTINSGFAFEDVEQKTEYGTRVGYLGTVDFKKLNPMFFDVMSELDVIFHIWGKPSQEAFRRGKNIKSPLNSYFFGHTDDPPIELKYIDIFFYPLQPDHYGTGENALVEAMSVGCVPVVLNNRAETDIVQNGKTGFVCTSTDDCVDAIKYLINHPPVLRRMGEAAVLWARENRSAAQSAQEFLDLWGAML